jgi:hypothetical protein
MSFTPPHTKGGSQKKQSPLYMAPPNSIRLFRETKEQGGGYQSVILTSHLVCPFTMCAFYFYFIFFLNRNVLPHCRLAQNLGVRLSLWFLKTSTHYLW